MKNYQDTKIELINAAKKLFSLGLLYKGEHANLTARTADGNIVMFKDEEISNFSEESFAVLDSRGNIMEGEFTAAKKEVIEMHTAIYKVKPNVNSIIHVHAPNCTVFAVAHQELPIAYEPLLRFGIVDAIPVVPWALRGSEASVKGIIQLVEKYPHLPAVLLANHGVLGFYTNTILTVQLLATLDEAAELILKARMIGGEEALPAQAFEQVKKYPYFFPNYDRIKT